MSFLSHYIRAATLPGRSATLLYILYVVGGVRVIWSRGVRPTTRPNMTDQNTKSNWIWVEFGTREFTKSLIINLNPLPPYIEIQKSRMTEKNAHFSCVINLF